MIQDLQQALVTRLKTMHPGVKVDIFPDRPESTQMTGAKGCIFVLYLGSDFASPQETGPSVEAWPMDHQIRLAILVVAAGINGASGSLNLMESVIQTLSGWTPPGWQAITVEQARFVGRDNNLWTHQVIIKTAQT